MSANGRVEIRGGDAVPGLEPGDALHARDVQQHAPVTMTPHLLDAVALGALARHEVGVEAVVEPAVEEAVAQRVPLGPALQGHDHHVVGEAHAAGPGEGAGGEVGTGQDHAVDGVERRGWLICGPVASKGMASENVTPRRTI